MNIAIVICLFAVWLLSVLFLFWKNNYNFISPSASDWLILVWYKEISHEYDDEAAFDRNNVVHIEFIPIIGWKYDYWPSKGRRLVPITPTIYTVKERLHDSDGCVKLSYWIRNGREFEISSEWTSGNNFWGSLAYYVTSGDEIRIHSNIPEGLQAKIHEILERRIERPTHIFKIIRRDDL